MRQSEYADDERPSEYFKRKVAALILKGRFGRAQREVHRFNAGKRDKVRLLPTKEEQIRWAEMVFVKKGL